MDLIFILTLIIVFGAAFGFLFYRNAKNELERERRLRDTESNISKLISEQLKEMRGTVDGTSQAMNKQIKSFTTETEKLRSELNQIQEAMENVTSFQEFFTSPKARGEWGEASLEHILGEYFPSELYKTQHMFKSGEQVDAVLKLPNEKFLPIDSKFPFDNYRKMIETEREDDRDKARKRFLKDAKMKITDIANKYILPSEGTVEFAIMYIPAEAVYYEINMSKDIDVVEYAREKKVILASPNTIFLTLKAVEHWFRDTQISRKTQEIIKNISRIEKDSHKLRDDFRKLGKHLSNARSAYESSEKRLNLMGDKVERLTEKEVDFLEEKEED